MNKQKKTTLIKISLLFTFLLFLSCNDDLYNNHEHNHGENKNKISLSQFKSETKIKDFKTIIKSNIQAMKSTNRNAELSDFVIDTLAIQRHISQNSKTTYSFKIYPLSNISLSNESYNLVYRLENNNWEQSIFLIKTNSNFELSEINHLYDSFLENNSVNQRGVTACISTTPVTYCTGQSACADRCDATTSAGCPRGECYRYVITTIGDCSTGGGGSSDPNNGNPSDNSQSGYLPTNPYEFTPNMFDNPVYDDPNYVNAIKAQHFFSNLSYAQQVWANENVENYNQLIQYQINNNWSNESEQFVEELIDLAIENNATFNFDNTINNQNGMYFNTLEEYKSFLENSALNGSNYQYNVQQNEKTATCEFQNGLYGIEVSIKQKMQPTYEILQINSQKFGISLLLTYEQVRTNVDMVGSYVFIDVYGKEIHGVKIGSFEGLTIEVRTHYRITIDKNYGTIISSIKIR